MPTAAPRLPAAAGMGSWGAGWCWTPWLLGWLDVVKPNPSLYGLTVLSRPHTARPGSREEVLCFFWAAPYTRKKYTSRNTSRSQDLDRGFSCPPCLLGPGEALLLLGYASRSPY